MNPSKYRIEYQSDDLFVTCILSIDREKVSDDDLIDVLGCTENIAEALRKTDNDLELAVANSAGTSIAAAAYAFADCISPGAAASEHLKRCDGWCCAGLSFDFVKIELEVKTWAVTAEKIEEDAT